VTGETNLKSATTVVELAGLAASGHLIEPCGVEVLDRTLASTARCTPAETIAAAIQADQSLVALLPPGLVEPATKVLPVDGDGPFGLFGADIFGDPAARSLPYPIMGLTTGSPPLAPNER